MESSSKILKSPESPGVQMTEVSPLMKNPADSPPTMASCSNPAAAPPELEAQDDEDVPHDEQSAGF